MIEIKGNFWVGNLDFVNWFYFVFQPKHKALFDKTLNSAGFEHIMNNVQAFLGKPSMTLEEFVVLFCFMYNETNFESMGEIGSGAYFNAHGYGEKDRGRSPFQLTSAGVYRVILNQQGYNYDSLTTAELDKLFQDPKVYFRAMNTYLTHPHLAGNAWAKAKQGDYYGFAMAIAGASGDGYARTKFVPRCEALMSALRAERLQNSDILAYKPIAKKVAIAGAVAGIAVGTYYLIKNILK